MQRFLVWWNTTWLIKYHKLNTRPLYISCCTFQSKKIEEENLHPASSAEIIALVLQYIILVFEINALECFTSWTSSSCSTNPHSTTSCSSAWNNGLCRKQDPRGVFFFFVQKKPQLKFKWGEILLLVGFPLWDLQNFELKVTESNRDTLSHLDPVHTHRMQ